MEQMLYEQYDVLKNMGMLDNSIPLYISNNLNPNFKIREYQKESFVRFNHHLEKNPNKTLPINLLYNMATGSGKTFVMAGLILELYNRGYRNFLFFVNSTNIIDKTKDNFCNSTSSKYLFSDKIVLEEKEVSIQKVSNFSTVNNDNINIKFTTIQGLHMDLNSTKENNLSYEDFEDKKIVILSDESHHINSLTKSGKLNKTEQEEKNSWEYTVMKILKSNKDNLLLEFTATLDPNNKNITIKYADKIIYKYDLKQFRLDGYSKEVDIISSELEEKDRILQALILSQYRLKVALKNNIFCKPVILFKAQKTIAESENNLVNFNKLIKKLKNRDLAKLKNNTDIDIIKKAFDFFEKESISLDLLVKELKEDFSEEKTISANNKSDLVSIRLNTLEDKNNPIRAIFAVAKLNEGWDVLNLFDIVRLYDNRDSSYKNGIIKPGKGTVAEAQLIGRGARYFPFYLEGENKFKRKFDGKNNDLKILETFYYHSVYNVQYIDEIKQALKNEGMIDDNTVEKELKLKDSFIKTDFYKNGLIYINKRIKNKNKGVNSLQKVGISSKIFDVKLFSGHSKEGKLFNNNNNFIKKTFKEFYFRKFEKNIKFKAIATNKFYKFSNLQLFFPKLKSIKDFLEKNNYLGDVKINIEATNDVLDNLNNIQQLEVLNKVLKKIEIEIKEKKKEYLGTTEFTSKPISKIFDNKILSLQIGSEKANGMRDLISDKDWFAFKDNFGTSEEKELVKYFNLQFSKLQELYDNIYLVRNERHFAIYSFDSGAKFEPDFVLFMKDKKTNKQLNYQIFIEPKGNQFKDKDGFFDKSKEAWKNEFLVQIADKSQIMELEFEEYKLIGLPFYNKDIEESFGETFQEQILKISQF